MSLVQNVEEGQLLAVYHPAIQGTAGRDVTGVVEKANTYKELRPLTGKGTPTDYLRSDSLPPSSHVHILRRSDLSYLAAVFTRGL